MTTIFPKDATIKPGGVVKFGIDPTSDRLHVGHLPALLQVRKMAREGHPVKIVIGTFTARLGDPSGRNSMRPMMTADETLANGLKIAEQIKRLIPDDSCDIFMNGDWFDTMSMPEIMDVISKFSVGQVLERDAFQLRMQSNERIGLHEIMVPILQGLDSVKLQADIEIGGSDQLFNFSITRNVQEHFGQKPQACILMPLLSGTDGNKMSKSANNCIFLNEPPVEMFGHIMSISDNVMFGWTVVFHSEISPNNPMQAKKNLAFKIIAELHGDEIANNAMSEFERVFQKKEDPEIKVPINSTNLVDAITRLRSCSKGEAKRLIASGAVLVNKIKAIDDLGLQNGDEIKVGKRFFGIISTKQLTG